MKDVLSELVFASTVAKVFGDGAAWPVQVRKSLVVLLLVVLGSITCRNSYFKVVVAVLKE